MPALYLYYMNLHNLTLMLRFLIWKIKDDKTDKDSKTGRMSDIAHLSGWYIADNQIVVLISIIPIILARTVRKTIG